MALAVWPDSVYACASMSTPCGSHGSSASNCLSTGMALSNADACISIRAMVRRTPAAVMGLDAASDFPR